MTGTADAFPLAADECVIRTTPPVPEVARHAGAWVLTAAILASSMAGIDGSVVNVALPTVQRDLRATGADVLWVIEAYSLFLSALILVGGSLGDRLGRRRIFALGIIVFTLASIACGWAPNILVLIVARAVQGAGGALLVPGSLAIISAAFDQASRGRAIGTWSGLGTIATALGPVLGGWLVQTASWRWVFFLNVPFAVVTLAVLFRFVPESRGAGARGPLDILGATLVTLALGAIVYGLIEAGPLGLGNRLVLASLGLGVVLLGLFIAVEARAHNAMMPLDVFRSRTFSGANLLTLLLYGALGGSLYFLPFDLQQVQGYSPAEAGASFLPFTVIVFALSRWSGTLVDRYGAKLPLIIGPIITAVGFVLFAVPGTGGSYWTTFFPAVTVMSVGMAVVIAPLTTAVMNAVEVRRAGVASGVNNAVSRTAGLLAIAVLGLVVTATFNRALESQLNSLRPPAPVHAAMDRQRPKLAGMPIPRSVGPTLQARLRYAVREAFVAGFRTSMLVAAVLALASALFSAWLIEGKPEANERRGVDAQAGAP